MSLFLVVSIFNKVEAKVPCEYMWTVYSRFIDSVKDDEVAALRAKFDSDREYYLRTTVFSYVSEPKDFKNHPEGLAECRAALEVLEEEYVQDIARIEKEAMQAKTTALFRLMQEALNDNCI